MATSIRESWTEGADAAGTAILKTDQPKAAESNIPITIRHEFRCIAVPARDLVDEVTPASGRRSVTTPV
jgi:hypothetical protein